MNRALVRCRHPSIGSEPRPDQIDCVVGRDVIVLPQPIQDYCAELLDPVEQDLVLLAGNVAFADRRVPRRRGSGWSRDLRIHLPVSNPRYWSSPRIRNALHEALGYATGDRWAFEFETGFQPLVTRQSSLDFSEISDVVIPFSDGMDSFAQWSYQSARSVPNTPVRVHSKLGNASSTRFRQLQWNGSGTGVCLTIPFQLRVGKHPEPSYRTRSFLFYVLAALAAAKLCVSRIVIGENGVSSLGPSLLPYAGEQPHRGTHPRFTARLGSLVNHLLGTSIEFEHPQLFRTKGEMLQMANPLVRDALLATRSCVRGPRARLGTSHCGLCTGCLYRRVALHSIGQQDDSYVWNDLSGGTLSECVADNAPRNPETNDEDIAMHAIHSLESLARLGDLDPGDIAFRDSAWELASPDTDCFQCYARSLRDLCRTHAREWRAFKDQFAIGSLLRCYERNVCRNMAK